MSLLFAATASRRNRKAFKQRWATELSRGKVGGALGMNLFDVTGYSNETEAAINTWHNARDPGEVSYTFNPNLWCSELLPQLTCCVIHKDDCGTGEGNAGAAWRSRYGGVAITRRHVLYCGHAFSHAAGTWGPGLGITDPTRIRFIDQNGVTVDRTQIHQATAYTGSNTANSNGASLADMTVAVLDSDLPESIYIPRVAPSSSYGQLNAYELIALSQEWQPQASILPGTVASDYPQRNRQMLWITGYDTPVGFDYAVWSGDSGTPSFIQIDGSLVLSKLVGADTSDSYPREGWTWPSRMNALIALADANAIALGRMVSPTNYTVTVASDPTL